MIRPKKPQPSESLRALVVKLITGVCDRESGVPMCGGSTLCYGSTLSSLGMRTYTFELPGLAF